MKALLTRRRWLVIQASAFSVLACTGPNDGGGSASGNGGGAAMGQSGGAGASGLGTAGSGGSSAGATGGVMTSGGSTGASGAAATAGAIGMTGGSMNAGAAGLPPMGGAAGDAGTGGSAGMSATGGAGVGGGTAGMSGASGMAGSAGSAGGPTGPMLVSTINLRGASGCPGLRLGDINGDGRMDIVVGQPVNQATLDSYTPQRVVAVTAFDLKGNQLWQYGTPNNYHIASSDIPIQVYDMDGDGRAEVFANMSTTEITVLNGMTGQVLRRIPLPAAGSNDSIAFANLRGTAWPQDIIVKTRYGQFWAITGVDSTMGPAGTVLWNHRKGPDTGFSDRSTGHYPLAYDWNGDGKDEVMGGYDFMNSAGQTQWSVTTLGLHADTIFTGNMDGNTANGYEIVVCGDYGAAFEWQSGRRIWQNDDTVEVQQGGMGDYRKNIPGLEVVFLDRLRTSALGLKSNNFLYDRTGNLLQQENRPNDSGWLTVTENLNNWDGQGNDFIFSYRREEGVLLYDGNLRPVATFPYNGASAENFAQHANLCGDEKEEVIVYDETTAWIYANGGCNLDAAPSQPSLPQRYHLYNWSIYTGWITPDFTFYTPGSQR